MRFLAAISVAAVSAPRPPIERVDLATLDSKSRALLGEALARQPPRPSRGRASAVVEFRLLRSTTEPNGTATRLAGQVGLKKLKRMFRHGGKHEARHVNAGLHLWFEAEVPTGVVTMDTLASLWRDGAVDAAEERAHIRQHSVTPNDPLFVNQVNLQAIGMGDAWEAAVSTAGRECSVVVAVLNTTVHIVRHHCVHCTAQHVSPWIAPWITLHMKQHTTLYITHLTGTRHGYRRVTSGPAEEPLAQLWGGVRQ